MRAKFLKALRILPWLPVVLAAAYLFLADGMADISLGRHHRIAREFFQNTGGITKVQIFSLKAAPGTPILGTFPLLPYGKDKSTAVFATLDLEGAELDKFIECWEYQAVSIDGGAMCHDPPYGFRLYAGDKLVTETSICWHCSNFVMNHWWHGPTLCGFNPNTEQGKKLLAFCDQRLPYYRPPPKPAKVATPPVEPKAER